MKESVTLGWFAWMFFVTACTSELTPIAQQNAEAKIGTIHQSGFGTLSTGESALLFTLTNQNGISVSVTNFGGIVTKLMAPDRDGVMSDIVLGYDDLASYERDSSYFGAIVGRYANRIASGEFELDGQQFTLAKNDGDNHLHGGTRGFNKVVWTPETSLSELGPSLLLKYESPDGEEGYPGRLRTEVRYTLSNDDSLIIEYIAETDKPTPVNLTQHTYFNLSGAQAPITDHILQIDGDAFTPIDTTLIPTGEIASVAGTPFDFRTPTLIGSGLKERDQQLEYGRGFDHNWVLNTPEKGFRQVATLSHPSSGRLVEVWTDQPGLQFYSGNFLDGSVYGKGAFYTHRMGLCLETQHFPNSPNQTAFPNTVLSPAGRYSTKTVYRITTLE